MPNNQRAQRIVLALGMVTGTRASLGASAEAIEPSVHVCMERGNHTLYEVNRAQVIATRIFEDIGVMIEWHDYHRPHSCMPVSEQTILVRLVTRPDERADERDHPVALASSQPYGGNRIRVFYDRVLETAPGRVQYLLAYILAHEITHTLQGTDSHSDSGIMKARWDTSDYAQMEQKQLSFTDWDVLLIRRGLEGRKRRLGPTGNNVTHSSADH